MFFLPHFSFIFHVYVDLELDWASLSSIRNTPNVYHSHLRIRRAFLDYANALLDTHLQGENYLFSRDCGTEKGEHYQFSLDCGTARTLTYWSNTGYQLASLLLVARCLGRGASRMQIIRPSSQAFGFGNRNILFCFACLFSFFLEDLHTFRHSNFQQSFQPLLG